MPPVNDRIPATASNPHGHWESKRLVAFNERLLRRFGATWTSPPDLPGDWGRDPSLDDLRAEAAGLFAATFPARPVGWKDPRLCVLLPFWQTVLAPPTAALLVVRDPFEVAGSLARRDGLPRTLGLALWERYVRAASSALDGLPTLVIDYGAVLDDPVAFHRALAAFLTEIGIAVASLGTDDVVGALDRGMRRQRRAPGDAAGLPDSAVGVHDALGALQGPHHPWRDPALGPEPTWVSDVLALRREHDGQARALRAAAASRPYRLARWARRRR
jgi:hypothetical protein